MHLTDSLPLNMLVIIRQLIESIMYYIGEENKHAHGVAFQASKDKNTSWDAIKFPAGSWPSAFKRNLSISRWYKSTHPKSKLQNVIKKVDRKDIFTIEGKWNVMVGMYVTPTVMTVQTRYDYANWNSPVTTTWCLNTKYHGIGLDILKMTTSTVRLFTS